MRVREKKSVSYLRALLNKESLVKLILSDMVLPNFRIDDLRFSGKGLQITLMIGNCLDVKPTYALGLFPAIYQIFNSIWLPGGILTRNEPAWPSWDHSRLRKLACCSM